MWIFTKYGFLSIVEHKDNPDMLMVRGRVTGDIEHYWPDAEVIITPRADYLYRTTLPRKIVAQRVAKIVEDIDSTQFKPTVAQERKPFYTRVFLVLADMQTKLAARRTHHLPSAFLQ